MDRVWFYTRLLIRDTAVPRLPDPRDLIRGRIPSGACGVESYADFFWPVQVCDRSLCRRQRTQFLVGLYLGGPARVGGLFSQEKLSQLVQIEALRVFGVTEVIEGGLTVT